MEKRNKMLNDSLAHMVEVWLYEEGGLFDKKIRSMSYAELVIELRNHESESTAYRLIQERMEKKSSSIFINKYLIPVSVGLTVALLTMAIRYVT